MRTKAKERMGIRNVVVVARKGGGGIPPELNPFGSALCLAFGLTALKSHASQPHKLTSL